MIHRSFRYRLSPTAEQEETLWQFAGVTRLVYNLALEQRATFWRRGRKFDYVTQGHEITELRAEVPWIKAVPYGPLTQALRDLDKAFDAFFSGRARYPTHRTRGQNDAFRFQAKEVAVRRLNRRWSAIRVPKLGWVKFRDTRPINGKPANATVRHDALGWHVSFACEIEHEAASSSLPAVGIDRGIANTITLSTGEMLSTPATARLEVSKRRAQRILARRQRSSARYRKQRAKVSRIAAKIARVRADWRHRVTLDIAQRFGTVALEDLKVVNMTARGRGKRGLNRSILEQGWSAFERDLTYKLEERGGALIKVPAHYSSQTCSACGTVDSKARESQARFACHSCGSVMHADHNAALVILRRSTPAMPVEVAGYGAVEAGTVNLAA